MQVELIILETTGIQHQIVRTCALEVLSPVNQLSLIESCKPASKRLQADCGFANYVS